MGQAAHTRNEDVSIAALQAEGYAATMPCLSTSTKEVEVGPNAKTFVERDGKRYFLTGLKLKICLASGGNTFRRGESIRSLRVRHSFQSVPRVTAPILRSSNGLGRMKKSGTAAYKNKLLDSIFNPKSP